MKKYFLLTLLAALLLGCKPTEKNYQNAYSKAYEASRRKAEKETTGENGRTLEALDGPRREIFGTDTIMVGSKMVKPFESTGDVESGKNGIAVARYSMATNARRHLLELKKEYPQAFMAQDGDDNYYVIIKRVASLPEAVDPIRIFETNHPGYNYIGLQGEPYVFFIEDR